MKNDFIDVDPESARPGGCCRQPAISSKISWMELRRPSPKAGQTRGGRPRELESPDAA